MPANVLNTVTLLQCKMQKSGHKTPLLPCKGEGLSLIISWLSPDRPYIRHQGLLVNKRISCTVRLILRVLPLQKCFTYLLRVQKF